MVRTKSKKLITVKALSTTNHMCGLCNKTIHGDPKTFYIATCDVCNQKCYIHPNKKCANTLWKCTSLGQASNLKNTVSKEIFDAQTSVGLSCQKCQQNCFLCKTQHHNFSE